MLACQNGHKATIRTLLEGGADVHAKSNVRDQMMTMMIIVIVLTIKMQIEMIVCSVGRR